LSKILSLTSFQELNPNSELEVFMKHVRITISGLVQGVFFRHHTQETAQKMQVKGYVCNLESGDVLIEAEGEEKVLREFLEWCHHGPARSIVENVKYEFTDKLDNFKNFSIRR